MPSLSPQSTAITLEIAGLDQTSLLVAGSVSITGRLNQRWEASFRLYDPSGAYSTEVGKNIIIYEDGERAFTGKIDEIEAARVVNHSNGAELFLDVRCVDLMSRLDQRVCSEPSAHLNVTAGYIVFFAMSQFAWSEGITFSPAASPGGFIEDGADVEKFVFNKQTVLDVIESMCKLSDFVAYVDVNGELHFETAGASYPAPFSISATSANFSRISISRSKGEGAGSAGSGYYNQSWTRTSWAAWEQRLNTFTGDGSTDEWVLYDPDTLAPLAAAIVVDVKVNGKSVDFGGEEEGRAYTWYYGEDRLTLAAGEAIPTSDDTIEVWFHSIDQGYIFVQDLTEINARGVIEGNSGQCARIFDDSQESNFQAATDRWQANLDQAKHIVPVVTLEANGFGANPIFPRPGMLFAASLSYPAISGNWSIQEVSARETAGAGLRYTCKCVQQASSRRLANGIDYFRELARKKPGSSVAGGAGDGGPKTSPLVYRFLVKDTTVGDNIGDNISVFGAVINQASRIRRVVGTLRAAIDSDLTVRFTVRYAASPVEDHVIGEFTIPSGATLDEPIVWSGVDLDWDVLPDLSVLIPDIVASDGSKDAAGVASFLIETIGRGNELPTSEGVGWMSTWDSGTTYALDDIVHYGGSTYISLQNSNTGNTPGSSPAYWDLVSSQGATGPAGADGADGVGVPAGGTTGQALVKASGTDYDTTWADRVAPARSIATTAPLTGGGDLSADRTLAISDFTGDSGSGGAKGAVPAPASGDAAAGKFLKASGGWAVPSGGSGTVTHTGGALTSDLPIFGAGTDDVKTGTKSGDTNKVVTQGAGTPSAGQPLLYDASGNAIPGSEDQLVPALTTATEFLRGDGVFAVPPGGGGVAGGYPDNYVQPPTSSWSWINQGSITESTSEGYLHYKIPTSSSVAYRLRSAPGSTPWSVRAALDLFVRPDALFGLAVRRSSNNKILIVFMYGSSDVGISMYVQRYTGSSVDASVYGPGNAPYLHARATLGIKDDGTDLTFYYGMGLGYTLTDGLIYTEARATHLGGAPDQIGLVLFSSGNPFTADCISWETL